MLLRNTFDCTILTCKLLTVKPVKAVSSMYPCQVLLDKIIKKISSIYSCQVLLDKTIKAASNIHPCQVPLDKIIKGVSNIYSCQVPLDTAVKGVSSCTLSAKADNVVFNFGITTSGGLFGVTADGVLTAKSGTIGGLTLSENSISASNGLFSVNSDGYLTAESGAIGGFTIGSSALYNGINSMTASGTGVYLGTDGLNLGGRFKVTNKGGAIIGEDLIGVSEDDATFITMGENNSLTIMAVDTISIMKGHLNGANADMYCRAILLGELASVIQIKAFGTELVLQVGNDEARISANANATIRFTSSGGDLTGNWTKGGRPIATNNA